MVPYFCWDGPFVSEKVRHGGDRGALMNEELIGLSLGFYGALIWLSWGSHGALMWLSWGSHWALIGCHGQQAGHMHIHDHVGT